MTVLCSLSAEADLVDLVRSRRVHSVYQPIVDLDTRATVAYEALARGPQGHPLERPDQLFAAARSAGFLGELDQACRAAALTGARIAGMTAPWTLFVNVEPAAIRWSLDRAVAARGVVSDRALPQMLEITERDLTADPVALLRFVEAARDEGCGIALDDVGAERASLALLPLLRPDVIKLDLRLVQQRPTAEIAEIFGAVNAEAERSGSVVLAEGIETEAHLDVARGLGARLGQGWLLGRPGPLPAILPPGGQAVSITARASLPLSSAPFEVAARWHRPRAARKQLLIEVSKHLEREALRLGTSVIIAAALQHARFLTPATKQRYTRLAASAAFAAIVGESIPTEPIPGLRGGNLQASDPLLGEWDIAVLGPHFAAALVARDLGDTGPDAERRFEYILTHDRAMVTAVAAALIGRVTPATP